MLRGIWRSQGSKLLLDRLKASHSAPWPRKFHCSAPTPALNKTAGLWRKKLNHRRLSSSAELAEQAVDEGEDEGPTVVEYLQSLGINTTGLGDLELPKLRSVMKERIDYLRDVIGLSIKDINDYPLMIGCSVRKNLSPVVQYLLDLKVTKNSLAVLVRKYPQVLHTSVAIDLVPNVRFIQGLGIELKQVGSVLTRYPQLLGFRIEGTMSTSVAYLVMIGVDKRQIGPLLTEKPEIMGMRVGNNLRPKVEFIVSCGLPHLVVGKMIENRPFILEYDVEDRMRPAVDALLEMGVRKEALPGMLIQYPEVLGLKVKDKVETKLPWLINKVGICREDMPAILEKLPQILAISVPTGTKRVHTLRAQGLTKEQVARMVVACPQLLGLSMDKRIGPNAAFFVKEMKRDIKDLLEFPAFLTYDLDTRIRPRFQKIREKGITQYSLAWMLNCSDARFEERLKAGYSPDASAEVDASFDTVGRLRVHEDVPSDDEDVNKQLRPIKLRTKASPRAYDDEDENRPRRITRSTRASPRAHDEDDENRPWRITRSTRASPPRAGDAGDVGRRPRVHADVRSNEEDEHRFVTLKTRASLRADDIVGRLRDDEEEASPRADADERPQLRSSRTGRW